MKKNFLIDHEDYAFRAYSNYDSEFRNRMILRGNGNILDICFDLKTCNIIYIEGTVIENILNENFYLPDIRSDENLSEYDSPSLFYNHGDLSSFILNFIDDELNIIINEGSNPEFVYVDDRIEYYYDEHFKLIYIKISNLTEIEKNYFSSFIAKKI